MSWILSSLYYGLFDAYALYQAGKIRKFFESKRNEDYSIADFWEEKVNLNKDKKAMVFIHNDRFFDVFLSHFSHVVVARNSLA
jgi:hypothetical protein